MASWQPMPPGTVLHGRYEVEALSGRGGFGATYRVRDRERFGQVCALKELLPTQAENPKVRELFEREARTLLSLRHTGIPAFHAFFVRDGRYYLVEDFIAGQTLARELEDKGRFSEGEVVAVMDEVLSILEYLHGRTPAVIHRDIKPANLIRADTGALYLVDFGAVKEAMAVAALSAESTIIGTSGYTPPEQLRGLVMPASDLYALGAMALHLLTGRGPADWFNVMAGAWRFAGQIGVSRRLDGILGRLLEEQLARRFQGATAVREALRGGASATRAPLPAPADTAFRPATAPWRSWRWLGGGALAAVVVAGAAAATLRLGGGADRPAPALPSVAVAPPVASAPTPPASATPVTAAPSPAAPPEPAPAARPPREPGRPAGRVEPRAAAPEARRPSPPVESRPRAPEPARVAEPAPAASEPGPETAAPEPAPKPRVTLAPAAPASPFPHRMFAAPVDRVWVVTESTLKGLGWDIDKRDHGTGMLITESRRLQGEDFGLYAKDLRHRLRVQLRPAGEGQTLVTVERLVFRRERIFWVNSDEAAELPEALRNQQIEQGVLAAIGRSL